MSNDKIILEGCIKAFKESNEIDLTDSEVFEIFSLTQIHKDSNVTYENIISSIVDGGNDGGIDSIMVFIDDEFIDSIDSLENIKFNNGINSKFIISQCKKVNSFKESTIDKLITTVPVLFDLENNKNSKDSLLTRFNSDLVDQALLLTDVWEKTAIGGGKISLEYVYIWNASDKKFNNVFSQKFKQLISLTKGLSNHTNVSFSTYSSNELLELYQKQKLNRLVIEFKDRPLSIDFEENDIGYIGTVKLGQYKKFLTSESGDIRDDLFESNIRHFQGLVDVNKNIRKSIENPSNEDFWWLNNGITIIAEEPKEVGKKLSIENIQIVNGLQTSYSIFNHHNLDIDDNRSVLVKVIINKNKETTDNIIASTNSQNPVSATLLRATEPVQRDIELFFLNEGYYYDRRKNYYKNQSKPATKIFSIQLTAQSVQSIANNDPHTARSRPTSLLKTESNYANIFDSKKDFKGILNCCLIYKKGHSFWLKYTDIPVKNKTSNFKLHIGMILSKEYFQKTNVTFGEISGIDINLVNEEIFNNSINFLSKKIDDYLRANPETNLINIAKNKDFTDYLLERLNNKYSIRTPW